MHVIQVEKNQIISIPMSVPKTWKNNSLGRNISVDTLVSIGLWPVTYVNEDYDPKTQNRTGPEYAIQTNFVSATYAVVSKSTEEVLEANKQIALNVIDTAYMNTLDAGYASSVVGFDVATSQTDILFMTSGRYLYDIKTSKQDLLYPHKNGRKQSVLSRATFLALSEEFGEHVFDVEMIRRNAKNAVDVALSNGDIDNALLLYIEGYTNLDNTAGIGGIIL